MRHARHSILRIIAISLYAIFCQSCVFQTAGIETTNGDVSVAAKGTSISGTAPVSAKVSIFDTDYMPAVDSGLAFSTIANHSGEYNFDNLPLGTYTLIAETHNSSRAVMFNNVELGQQGLKLEKNLEPVGSISGVVHSGKPINTGILIFLLGTGYYTVQPGPGPFSFEALPPGEYNVQASLLQSSGSSIKPTLISEQTSKRVYVLPDSVSRVDTLTIP